MKKVIVFFTSLLMFYSCQFFDKKVPDENQLLQEELKKINWQKVDHYPTVASCDTLLETEQQKECLFQYLIQTIQERIGVDTIQVLYPELDTLSVLVTIDPDASIHFKTQAPQDTVSYNYLQIDSILQQRLQYFPPVEPAIKQGVKVKSQFVLPVILKVTE